MSIPGGLPPPRPDQMFSDPGAPMAPGAQTPTVRARTVLVYGPTGSLVGVFVYATGTVPGPGNGPVDSITRAPTDLFGNAVQQDFVAYGPGGSYAQLTNGALNFVGSAGQFLAAQIRTELAAGLLDFLSGLVNSSDVNAEFTLQSQAAAGITNGQAILNAGQFSVNAQTLFSGQVNVPAGDGPFILNESFHDVSGGAGIGTVRAKLLPWNATWLDVEVSSGATGTFNLGSFPSAGYYPTQARHLPLGLTAGSDGRIFIPTSGNLQIIVGGSGAWSGGWSGAFPTN